MIRHLVGIVSTIEIQGRETSLSVGVSSAYNLICSIEDVPMHGSRIIFGSLLLLNGHRNVPFFTLLLGVSSLSYLFILLITTAPAAVSKLSPLKHSYNFSL